MRVGFNETCLEHDTGPRHPETADRLRSVRRSVDAVHGGRVTEPEPATRETIEAIHDASYVGAIHDISRSGGGTLDADTVASEGTWDAALASAGLAEWAAHTAATTEAATDIPFALGRPPGHHALSNEAMGFCIFNNAAVAAQSIITAGMAETVAIFDWDVHHGNGTEEIFLDRADVPFVSIHQDDIYPGSGPLDELGIDAGAGANLNIPLAPGANTASYVLTMDELVSPWLIRHTPDVILVSAGFDAHQDDPISRMSVTTEGFGLLTKAVLEIAATTGASVGFILEGGYNLEALAEGVQMVHSVCGGYDPEPPVTVARDVDRDVIHSAQQLHGLGS